MHAVQEASVATRFMSGRAGSQMRPNARPQKNVDQLVTDVILANDRAGGAATEEGLLALRGLMEQACSKDGADAGAALRSLYANDSMGSGTREQMIDVAYHLCASFQRNPHAFDEPPSLTVLYFAARSPKLEGDLVMKDRLASSIRSQGVLDPDRHCTLKGLPATDLLSPITPAPDDQLVGSGKFLRHLDTFPRTVRVDDDGAWPRGSHYLREAVRQANGGEKPVVVWLRDFSEGSEHTLALVLHKQDGRLHCHAMAPEADADVAYAIRDRLAAALGDCSLPVDLHFGHQAPESRPTDVHEQGPLAHGLLKQLDARLHGENATADPIQKTFRTGIQQWNSMKVGDREAFLLATRAELLEGSAGCDAEHEWTPFLELSPLPTPAFDTGVQDSRDDVRVLERGLDRQTSTPELPPGTSIEALPDDPVNSEPARARDAGGSDAEVPERLVEDDEDCRVVVSTDEYEFVPSDDEASEMDDGDMTPAASPEPAARAEAPAPAQARAAEVSATRLEASLQSRDPSPELQRLFNLHQLGVKGGSFECGFSKLAAVADASEAMRHAEAAESRAMKMRAWTGSQARALGKAHASRREAAEKFSSAMGAASKDLQELGRSLLDTQARMASALGKSRYSGSRDFKRGDPLTASADALLVGVGAGALAGQVPTRLLLLLKGCYDEAVEQVKHPSTPDHGRLKGAADAIEKYYVSHLKNVDKAIEKLDLVIGDHPDEAELAERAQLEVAMLAHDKEDAAKLKHLLQGYRQQIESSKAIADVLAFARAISAEPKPAMDLFVKLVPPAAKPSASTPPASPDSRG